MFPNNPRDQLQFASDGPAMKALPSLSHSCPTEDAGAFVIRAGATHTTATGRTLISTHGGVPPTHAITRLSTEIGPWQLLHMSVVPFTDEFIGSELPSDSRTPGRIRQFRCSLPDRREVCHRRRLRLGRPWLPVAPLPPPAPQPPLLHAEKSGRSCPSPRFPRRRSRDH